MSVEKNKESFRQILEELYHRGNLSVVDETFAADFFNHSPAAGTTPDREGIKQTVSDLRRAFPDIHLTIEHLIAEGDMLAAWFMARCTHEGEYLGISPTGKRVAFQGATILRIAKGKAVERWNITDRIGLMQQLGVLP